MAAVASQLTAGEKILPTNSHILSKSMNFGVSCRLFGSDSEIGIEIFGYNPTVKAASQSKWD